MSQLSRFWCLNRETSLSRRSLISHYLRLTSLDIINYERVWIEIYSGRWPSWIQQKMIQSQISLIIVHFCLVYVVFNNYSTSRRWIWDDSQRGRSAKLAIIISYPTSACGIIVLLKTRLKRNFKFKVTPTLTIFVDYGIFKDCSLKSRWMVLVLAEYLPCREVNILPLFTEIEKNNCFSIYSLSDLNNTFCGLTP